jgi:hypothetical protein
MWKPSCVTLQQTILSLKSKLRTIASGEIFGTVELAEEGLKEIEVIGL